MEVSLNVQTVEPEAHAIRIVGFHKPTEAFTDTVLSIDLEALQGKKGWDTLMHAS